MLDVAALTRLQQETVALWHRQEISNPFTGFEQLVCQQHEFNYRLWHEEDLARSREASDAQIAQVKRNIDRFNQQRNDAIEKLDDWLVAELARRGVQAAPDAPLNTETPGSAIDRLSILALRLYHMQEQADRADADAEHRAKVLSRLAILHPQHRDLSDSLQQLLDDVFAGRRRLKVYRQFKMYNDPTLNPYLYQPRSAK